MKLGKVDKRYAVRKKYIWGTGYLSKMYTCIMESDFVSENNIRGYIDNNTSKRIFGHENLKVYIPDNILNGEDGYDIYILVRKYDDISKQIENINKDRKESHNIYCANDLNKLLVDYYDRKYDFRNSKILYVHGENSLGYYNDRLFSEYTEKENADYITDCSYIFVEDYFGDSKDDYQAAYSDKFSIPKNNIFGGEVARLYRNTDMYDIKDISGSNYYIIPYGPKATGLGSGWLRAQRGIIYAKKRGWIPVVDWRNHSTGINEWNYYFRQPEGVDMDSLSNKTNKIYAAVDYEFEIDLSESEVLFDENEEILEKVDEFCDAQFGRDERILGVLCRGTDYVSMKPIGHPIQPSTEEMINKIKEVIDGWKAFDRIFLCTEDKRILNRFIEEFGNRVFCYDQKRITDYRKGYLYEKINEDDKIKRNIDYWISICALARTEALIAGDCCGSRIAQLKNQGKYIFSYIFDLGMYR